MRFPVSSRRPRSAPRCPIRPVPATAVLLALVACQQTELAKVSQPPVVSIETPVDGSIVDEGATVPMRGRVVDEDYEGSLDILAAVWTVDSGRVCEDSVVDADGIITCDYAFEAGSRSIGLTVTDPDGLSDSATSNITVAEVNYPSVSIEQPTNGQVVNEGDLVTFTALVSDVEDRASDLAISWTSSLDGEFSTQGASSDGEASFVTDQLSVGNHTIDCTVTDTGGHASVDHVTLIVNGAPTAPGVEISPDPGRTDAPIVASIVTDSTDPNGDDVTYRYEWYMDGVVTTDTSNTISPPALQRGHTWTVRVYPSDGYGEGEYGTDSVSIENGAPSATSVTIDPTTAYTDDTLTAVVSGWSDPDGDAEAYRYAWSVNGTVISGAEDSTLTGEFFVKGDSVTVTATPWDGYDTGSSVTSGARVILNSAPTAPVVAIDPVLPEDDDNLLCNIVTESTDADGDSVSYTYSWKLNGAATAYTANSIPRGVTTVNDTWECTVTPSDGTASGPAGVASVVVDDYTAPAAPVLTSLTPYRDEDSATIFGTGEALCNVTLYIVNSTGTTTSGTTADAGGAFSYSLTGLTRGESYSFYATCTDAEGNVSPVSNTITTEVCDPIDDYEDSTGYGDVCTDPIVDWSVLSDAGTTTISFTGNILDSSDEDWYLIQTSDSVTGNTNYYRFHVELTHGSSEYGFAVYQGGCTDSYLECGSGSSTDPEGDGYTEFEDYAEDQGDGGHTIPSDTRACGSGSASYNLCDDLSDDYYIHVFRKASAGYSCGYYELQITNGVW